MMLDVSGVLDQPRNDEKENCQSTLDDGVYRASLPEVKLILWDWHQILLHNNTVYGTSSARWHLQIVQELQIVSSTLLR